MIKQDNNKKVEQLFLLKAHLGHRKNRLHPKARKYVYKIVNGVAIIDLTKTVEELEKAKEYIFDTMKQGKLPLIVATKKIISTLMSKLAEESKIPYITNKWLPGLLTNFDTIMKNVKKLIRMEEEMKTGAWNKFIKHEKIKLEKEVYKLRKLYSGIINLVKKPDLLIIVDIKKEKNALKEAQQNSIKTIAILDTNSNPDEVDFPIMANDDSFGSLEYLTKELIEPYIKSKVQMSNVKPSSKS